MTYPVTPGHHLGDFELIRELGSGGMGTVWEAEQASLGRRVALKILAPHISMSPTSLQRFQREAEAGARLTHPNIVAVHSVGEADGAHFIAQELVEGGRSLADRIKSDRDLPELPKDYYQKVAELFAQVADALQMAHDGGIIHRDVKPANILLTKDGEPKVADFGLAQVEDALELSRSGEFAGTPFYMSPEQAMSKRMGIDHRTDIFSLGVTLWEALALQRPFEGDTSQQVLEKIVTETPSTPRKIRSKCPDPLAIICLKAMEKEVGRRFQSMSEFSADIRRFLVNEPIRAKPPTFLYRTWKWVGRHYMASLLLGTFMCGLFVSVFLWQRAARNQETAIAAADALQGMISALAPTTASKTPERTHELLNSAEKLVREEVTSPQMKANLLVTLSNVLLDTGEYQRALNLVEEVLELIPEEESQAKSILRIKDLRAKALLKLQEFTIAREAYQNILVGERRLYGNDSEQVYSTLDHLGIIEVKSGNLPEARRLLEEALAGRRKIFGNENLLTLATLNNLAGVLHGLGEEEAASEKFELVLEVRRKILGDDHPQTLSVLGNLGAIYAMAGNLEKAAKIFTEVVEKQKMSIGEDHPTTLQTQHNLVFLLRDLGELDEAETLARETRDRLRATVGDSHPLTFATTSALAEIWDLQERPTLSAGLHREAVAGVRAKLGDEHPIALDILFRYISHLLHINEYKKALEMVQVALPGFSKQFGSNHPDTVTLKGHQLFLEAKALTFKAWALVDPDRKDKDSDVKEGLAIIQRLTGNFGAEALCIHGGDCPYDTLAWAHFANGNYEKAIAASKQALEFAPTDRKSEFEGYLARLQGMIVAVMK